MKNINKNEKDYVQVIYNEHDRPLTSYPNKLTRYLFDNYIKKNNLKLLDVGCGRGEFLNGFLNCGLDCFGADQSKTAKMYNKSINLKLVNLETDPLPYKDNFFDVVFSKSVLEHFYKPELLVKEMHRVLKPGGTIITLCPDWYYNYRIYFEDYTHRTPFMKSSLRDIHLINGFERVNVMYFRQLPFLWEYPVFTMFAEITRLLLPEFMKPYSKWIRFSKEIMLLSVAKKI